MSNTYRCMHPFNIELYDEAYMPTGGYKPIPEGTIWELDEFTNNIGGEVHLENEELGWIEISQSKLNNYFEEV